MAGLDHHKSTYYTCGVLQLCLPYLDGTTGASAEAWVEFSKEGLPIIGKLKWGSYLMEGRALTKQMSYG